MLGYSPGLFWKVCWVAISPAFLAVSLKKDVLIYHSVQYSQSVTAV